MTAQIDDMFRYRQEEFALAGISEGELFDPAFFDLRPTMASTACWRGYQAVFSLLDSQLVLETLHIRLPEEDKKGHPYHKGPILYGITPSGSREDFDFFNNHYEGLNFPLAYSGGLLITAGFIPKLYVHMGFHPAWKYETVIELIFQNGQLQREFDRSAMMSEIRQRFQTSAKDYKSDQMPTEKQIEEFVENAFDRSY